MTLNEAAERDYAESDLVTFLRAEYPAVPEAAWRALFIRGYNMGSLFGFNDARHTLEKTLMEFAHGAAH